MRQAKSPDKRDFLLSDHKPDHSDRLDYPVQWVFGDLYICKRKMNCCHRTSFGLNDYCSWLLGNGSSTEPDPPCIRRMNECVKEQNSDIGRNI